MRKKISFMLILVLGLAGLAVTISSAQSVPFSLRYDMIITNNKMPQSMTVKVFKRGDSIRTEMKDLKHGIDIITIATKNEVYQYMPQQNMAMIIPVEQFQKESYDLSTYYNDTSKVIGEEMIEGRLCEIRQSIEGQNPYKAWIAKDINLPIKVETREAVTQFKNIEVNPTLNDDLFILPAGVQVNDLGAMMGNVQNIMKASGGKQSPAEMQNMMENMQGMDPASQANQSLMKKMKNMDPSSPEMQKMIQDLKNLGH